MRFNKKGNRILFEKNARLLSLNLQKRLMAVNEEEIWNEIQILINEQGLPIAKIRTENQSFISVNSKYPMEDAENWLAQHNLEDMAAIFLYGSGFGYILYELLEKKEQNTIIFIFEENIYLFCAMLYYVDLEPVMETQKFSFFIENPAEFKEDFQGIFFTEVFLYCTYPAALFTPIAQRNFKMKYKAIHEYVFNTLALNVSLLGNDHYDTLLGFHNLIDNVDEVLNNPSFNSLKNLYAGVPAFIIANGPSLDKNIDELKEINGKGLILAVESAISPLLKKEINPDAICVIERIKNSYLLHFQDKKYPSTISLLSLALIDKQIYSSFSGPRVPIFRRTESINVWLNKIISDGFGIDAGSNVSHLAFEIAVHLGANPIIFVGQDLAFGDDGDSHSRDAAYFEETNDIGKNYMSRLKSKPVIYVEGNKREKVATIQSWVDIRNTLEQKISNYSDKTVYNATAGGAKIAGAEQASLKNIVKSYCIQENQPKLHEYINQQKKQLKLVETKDKKKLLQKELVTQAEKYRKLSRKAVSSMIECKTMMGLAKQNKLDNVLEQLEEAYLKNFTTLQSFMGDNLNLCFLQQVFIIAFHELNHLGLINSPERIKKVFTIYYELFKNTNLICQSVATNFEMALDKLDNKIVEKEENY